jgi:hypothetical protein
MITRSSMGLMHSVIPHAQDNLTCCSRMVPTYEPSRAGAVESATPEWDDYHATTWCTSRSTLMPAVTSSRLLDQHDMSGALGGRVVVGRSRMVNPAKTLWQCRNLTTVL